MRRRRPHEHFRTSRRGNRFVVNKGIRYSSRIIKNTAIVPFRTFRRDNQDSSWKDNIKMREFLKAGGKVHVQAELGGKKHTWYAGPEDTNWEEFIKNYKGDGNGNGDIPPSIDTPDEQNYATEIAQAIRDANKEAQQKVYDMQKSYALRIIPLSQLLQVLGAGFGQRINARLLFRLRKKLRRKLTKEAMRNIKKMAILISKKSAARAVLQARHGILDRPAARRAYKRAKIDVKLARKYGVPEGGALLAGGGDES